MIALKYLFVKIQNSIIRAKVIGVKRIFFMLIQDLYDGDSGKDLVTIHVVRKLHRGQKGTLDFILMNDLSILTEIELN